MRRLLSLLAKDLRRRLAEPWPILLSLAVPLGMIAMMALAFPSAGRSDDEGAPKLSLVLVDLDDTPVSNMMGGSSQNPEMARRLILRQAPSREEGLEVMRREEAAAVVVIPKGFMAGLLEGKRAELELIKNPAQSVMPIVAQQGIEVVALYLSVGQRFLGEDGEKIRRLLEGEGWENTLDVALMIEKYRQKILAADDLLFPPLIETKTGLEQKARFDPIAWMYPGIVVMSILFVAQLQMRDLLREREAGTLRRLLASPATARQVLLSKILGVAAVATIAHLMLLGLGVGLMGVRFQDLGALAVASAVLVLSATGLMALLFSIVKTERQGDAFSGILIMVMSLLGGAFFPPSVFPAPLRTASLFTVNSWANDALRTLAGGGHIGEILGDLAVLSLLAAVTTAAGMAFLGRRHARGEL